MRLHPAPVAAFAGRAGIVADALAVLLILLIIGAMAIGLLHAAAAIPADIPRI